MVNKQRVFITGYSALTPCGHHIDETWEALLAGKSGIDKITAWDLSGWPCQLGAELKQFQPAKALPDKKLMKVISKQDAMGIHAALAAVEHSGLIPFRDSLNESEIAQFNDRTGVYVGSPGNKYFQQYDFLPLTAKTQDNFAAFAEQLFNEVHPMWLLRILPNNVLAYAGITYGFKGPNHNITNHAVSSTQAIIEAWHAIQSGQADRIVVVGYDIGIEPQALYYYSRLGVVSERHLKPFDHEHDGTILGEGAAAIVLESEASAKVRGARCYAEIMSGAAETENKGLFSIEAEGQALTALIQRTLDRAHLSPQDIHMVIAHGNGNVRSDQSEACALNTVFSDKNVPVTAFKWAVGHLLVAAGITETALAMKALQAQCVPGIAALTKAASGAEHLNIHAKTRQVSPLEHVLLINRGFASMNACLVLKHVE